MMGARDFASIHLSDNNDYVNYCDVETHRDHFNKVSQPPNLK